MWHLQRIDFGVRGAASLLCSFWAKSFLFSSDVSTAFGIPRGVHDTITGDSCKAELCNDDGKGKIRMPESTLENEYMGS